jgi:peptidoglycan/LPS O-acetylase OafA/YrhL
MSKDTTRIYGLDVVRAYAIVVVLVAHGRIVSGGWLDSLGIPFIPWIDGVEVFFVLSGYLIGQIILKILDKPERPTLASLGHFWKRRWIRTLPNYYLLLGINLLLAYFAILPNDVHNCSWHFLFFIHNFWDGRFNFFWESWSLSIEEWFYLLFPLLLWVLVGVFRKHKQRVILWGIFTLLLLPLLYRISISDTPVGGFYDWDVFFRKAVVTRLDAVIYGVLAAYLKFYHGAFWFKHRRGFFAAGLALCLLNIYLPKSLSGFYAKTFSFCVTSLGAALLLAQADAIKQARFPWLGRIITHISKISYSMYLTNLLVAQLLAVYFPLETNGQQAGAYLIFWSGTILISTLLYYGFEQPILKWRDR